jgi:hypothetical protein
VRVDQANTDLVRTPASALGRRPVAWSGRLKRMRDEMRPRTMTKLVSLKQAPLLEIADALLQLMLRR